MEILFAVMLGLFLGALDQTIVGPALPTIVTQLSGNDYYVWAITIYLLTSTISVPFWGKLSDIYGRKPIFMIGIVIFLIGSALSGLSQNMAMLILFRGIQGIGAGSLFPVALAIIGDLFTPAGARQVPGPVRRRVRHRVRRRPAHRRLADRERRLALDLLRQHPDRDRRADRHPAAPADGQDEVGDAKLRPDRRVDLHDLDGVPAGRPDQQAVQRLDRVRPSAGSSLIGIVGTLLFIFAESRAKEPIIPLHLWKGRTYSATMVSVFFAAFAFFGAIVFLPRWFQVVEGFSPTNSGLAALPLMIGLIGSSIVSGLIVSRTGRYKWLIVGSVAVMGFAVFLMTNLTKDTPVPHGVAVDVHRRPRRRTRRSRSRRSSSRTPCRSGSSASRPRTSRSSARSAARSRSRSSGRSSGRRSQDQLVPADGGRGRAAAGARGLRRRRSPAAASTSTR